MRGFSVNIVSSVPLRSRVIEISKTEMQLYFSLSIVI